MDVGIAARNKLLAVGAAVIAVGLLARGAGEVLMLEDLLTADDPLGFVGRRMKVGYGADVAATLLMIGGLMLAARSLSSGVTNRSRLGAAMLIATVSFLLGAGGELLQSW